MTQSDCSLIGVIGCEMVQMSGCMCPHLVNSVAVVSTYFAPDLEIATYSASRIG